MIMMIYKKGDSNQPEYLGETALRGTIEGSKNFMSEVDKALKSFLEEALSEPVSDTGLRSMRSCGDYWSSFREREGAPEETRNINGLSEGVLSARESECFGASSLDWEKTKKVVMTNGDFGDELTVGIDVYDSGYIISNSATGTNMFGGSYRLYFKNLTKTKFVQNSRSCAMIFKDERALLKYLKEHKNSFAYMVSQYGYEFGFEKASCLWQHEAKADMLEAVYDILSEINEAAPAEPEPVKVKDNAFDEAVSRMKEMDLYDQIVKDFISDNKLYMSEFGGILYDLNEDAEEAVRRTSKYGLPYHVVRNQSSIGDMYAVLYVSNYQEEWGMEHLDPRTGIIFANVYNANYGDDEMGSIGIKKANGGLMRVA